MIGSGSDCHFCTSDIFAQPGTKSFVRVGCQYQISTAYAKLWYWYSIDVLGAVCLLKSLASLDSGSPGLVLMTPAFINVIGCQHSPIICVRHKRLLTWVQLYRETKQLELEYDMWYK